MAELYDPTIEGLRAENERLRAVLRGVEIALARDSDIDGAMKLIIAAARS